MNRVTRFTPQQGLVPPDRLESVCGTLIGCGAIGRQIALQLASIGVRRLRLIDFDRVDATNITTQGYWQSEVGRAKVEATADAVQQIDPTIDVMAVDDRFRPRHEVGDVVFCAVDSIAARAAIWRSISSRACFVADGRMLGEVIRVLCVGSQQGRDHYPTTLFGQQEAHRGSCTSRSTIYAANIAAGLMVHQLARWLRGLPLDVDVSLNLLASEMSVLPTFDGGDNVRSLHSQRTADSQ